MKSRIVVRTNLFFYFKDENKLKELEKSVTESENRRPAHERKVEESQQSLAKAQEEKKKLEATVGDITKKRDQFVSRRDCAEVFGFH